MPNKTIAKVWTFESSSSKGKTYETLQYTDGSTSCNCPGWTRRVAADGSRSCKHTRWVHQGLADDNAITHKDYTKNKTGSKKAPPVPKKAPIGKTTPVAGRKIQWQ